MCSTWLGTFEPVHKLDEAVVVKTHEEDEEVLFKMYVHSLCALGRWRRGKEERQLTRWSRLLL